MWGKFLFNYKKILLVIFLFAAFLRLYNLGAGVLDNDEAKTALGVDFPHSFVLPIISVVSQNIFGINEFVARLPIAIFGVALVYLFFLFGKEFFSLKIGIFSAMLVAIMPSNVLFSRTVYLDIPLVFAWMLVIYFWFKYEKLSTEKNLLFLSLALFIAPWFKIQAVYLFFSLFVYLVVIKKGRFWRSKRFYLLVLSFTPFFFYFLSQPQQLWDMRQYVSGSSDSLELFLSFIKLVWNYYGVLFVFFVFGLIAVLKSRKNLFLIDVKSRINIFLLIFTSLILLVLSKKPSAYYISSLDISVIYFFIFFLAQIKKYKLLQIFLVFLVLLNILIIFQKDRSFDCVVQGVACDVWQKNSDEVNNKLEFFSNNGLIFVDSQLGFTAKWSIRYKTRKLEQYFEKGENITQNIALVLSRGVYEKNKDKFTNYETYNYGEFLLVLKK